VFLAIITRQANSLGAFTSVKDLITAMQAYIDAWNERCEPFTLDQGADSILTEVRS
jgi:hypothetical protein